MEGVFIVGYWNSGTTLLTDILRKHPDLSLKKGRFLPNLEERSIQKLLAKFDSPFHDFGDYSDIIENGFRNFSQPDWDENKAAEFAIEFKKVFNVRDGKKLLLKNPWLFFYHDWINSQFKGDNIRKIVILRNGYSQSVSKDYWLKSDKAPSDMLIARTRFWIRAMERFYTTWHLDEHCVTIRYENLCTNPNETLVSALEHLDLDPTPVINHIPKALENRMNKWEELDPQLRTKVTEIVAETQAELDRLYPLIQQPNYP